MTGGTGGRREIIFTNDPLVGVEVHLVDVGKESDAVLRLLINFLLRVIGAHVAFSAGVRVACLCRRECVAAVACRAASLRAIRVDPANSGVRPGGWVEFSFASRENFDLAAVALPAAVDGSGGVAVGESRRDHASVSFDDFSEDVIERSEDAARLGVVGAHKFFDNLTVAA